MDQQRVDMYLMANSKYFPEEKQMVVRQALMDADEARFNVATCAKFHDPIVILLISIFLGGLGIDRFMLGDTGLGVGKLLTAGGCGIWALIDIFLVMGVAKEKNFNTLMQALNFNRPYSY